MLDVKSVRSELSETIDHLVFEVNTLWKAFQDTDWFGDNGHFPNAHYGYIMVIFARIDLLSRYWNGGEIWGKKKRNQTARMVAFMDTYLYANKKEEHEVAVKLWRHTLMHTAEPRDVYLQTPNIGYKFLLHFGDWLPISDHYTFDILPGGKSLKLGIVYLVEDLRQALDHYLSNLDNDPGLQQKYLDADPDIRHQRL